MLAANSPIAFLATANPDGARSFYADTLGLTLRSEDDFSLVFDLAGILCACRRSVSCNPSRSPHSAGTWRMPHTPSRLSVREASRSNATRSCRRTNTTSGTPLAARVSRGSRTSTGISYP